MSQNTSINESIIVAKRSSGTKPATRFITLDRMPSDDSEVHDMHKALLECQEGLMKDGWGVVSHWSAERIESGDWTPAIWRSPELAEAAAEFANGSELTAIRDIPRVSIHSTYQTLHSNFSKSEAETAGAFPVLASKGADGQTRIISTPDEYRIPKNADEETRRLNGGIHPETERLLEKAGHLLITQGQDSRTGRLTATASDEKNVGMGFLPVTGLTTEEQSNRSIHQFNAG